MITYHLDSVRSCSVISCGICDSLKMILRGYWVRIVVASALRYRSSQSSSLGKHFATHTSTTPATYQHFTLRAKRKRPKCCTNTSRVV